MAEMPDAETADEVGDGQGVAIVTGGSGGIGRACAAALAARGYDVVVTARNEPALADAAKALDCRSVVADCSIEEEAARLVELAGAPRMLVHAAGTLEGTLVREQPGAVMEKMFRANLLSAYNVTHAALPTMGPGARIVFISSAAGLKGMGGMSAYSASKAGLAAFAQSLAAEVEQDGIGVHLVTPGPVRTPMIKPGQGVRQWPLEPEDVASAVVWLDSLHPRVVVREIIMRSTARGPFAPESLDP